MKILIFTPGKKAMPRALMQHVWYNTNDRTSNSANLVAWRKYTEYPGNRQTAFRVFRLDEKHKRASVPCDILNEVVVGELVKYGDFHGN